MFDLGVYVRQDWRWLFPGETSLLLFSRLCFLSPFITHTIQPLIPASLYATHPFAFCSRFLGIVFIPPMEIARWSEATFSPTHENSFTPPAIDADLHNRFRSLHISLNERRSPGTPCTTPDHLYPSRQPGKVALGNLLAPIRKHSFNRTKANHSDMVATRFDGSEGRFEGSSIDGLRRHPSQPEMQSGNAATIHARRSSTMSEESQGTWRTARATAFRFWAYAEIKIRVVEAIASKSYTSIHSQNCTAQAISSCQ